MTNDNEDGEVDRGKANNPRGAEMSNVLPSRVAERTFKPSNCGGSTSNERTAPAESRKPLS